MQKKMIMQTAKTSRESNPTPSNAHRIGIQAQCTAAVQALLKTTKEVFLQGTECSPLDHCYTAENLGSVHPNIVISQDVKGMAHACLPRVGLWSYYPNSSCLSLIKY